MTIKFKPTFGSILKLYKSSMDDVFLETSNFNLLFKNFLKKQINIPIKFDIYNTERFTDLLDYITVLGPSPKLIKVPHINYVYWPDYSSPTMLPSDYKIKVVKEISDWIKKNKNKWLAH